jgi:hypothetical protein
VEYPSFSVQVEATQEEEPVRDTLFDVEEMDKVESADKTKKNKTEKGIKPKKAVKWTNIFTEWVGGLYDQVSQDIENEEV